MTSQNFMIGPIKEGLRKDQKPFSIPEDSFESLVNAYQFRGRTIRRTGTTLLGNLANGTPVMGLRTQEVGANQRILIAFDQTQAYSYNGTAFVNLASVMPVVWSGTNYQFFYTTNYANAFWATNSVPGLNGYAISLFANPVGNTIQVTSAGNTFQVNDIIYFLNVSGAALPNNLRQGTVTVAGNPFTVTATDGLGAFTPGIANTGVALSTTRTVTGQDGIRYYANTSNVNPDGSSTAVGPTWVNYNPPVDPDNALAGALLIFPYRGYLVFLNTWEGSSSSNLQNFPNRARWTQIGTPYYSNPVPNTPNLQSYQPQAARDDIFGRGGANDAPTNEQIVAAEFIRDILVVYFNRSTWRLRFVNNTVNPFVWERVNVELGSDCTFSTIPLDKGLMAIGSRGAIISDANDTVRIDEKIPEDIFEIRQTNFGLKRVYGIRTFRSKLIYWTYPSGSNPNGTFPDLLLVYNYDTKNWSYFDDCYTCLGYYYNLSGTNQTWATLTDEWSSYTDVTWGSSSLLSGNEVVIAGNQQGFVFQLDRESVSNAPSLNISNISGFTVTCANHNLPDESWITLSGVTTPTYTEGITLNGRNFRISVVDENTFNLLDYGYESFPEAIGVSFSTTLSYVPILAGSVQINIGALQFEDTNLDGNLIGTGGSGTINYQTGALVINFSPPIVSTPVYVRTVAVDEDQTLNPISTTGAYTGSGQITKISNFSLLSKIFNFLPEDKRTRLSKIDFYIDRTQSGQFICNVFADSSDIVANKPISDNPQSNVVTTSVNPYQIGYGEETISRLFADVIAQTVQIELTLSDRQMAVNAISQSAFQLLAMMFTMRRGGRLI
jgi:hypothetical protein